MNSLEADLSISNTRKSTAKKGKTETFCPECDQRLKLGGSPRVGQIVSCSRCKTKLAIVSTDPLEIDVSEARRVRRDKKGRKQKPPLYQ